MADELIQSFFSASPFVILLSIVLDLCFGDPVYRLHPIRLLGSALKIFENSLRGLSLDGRLGGFLLGLILLSVTFSVFLCGHALCYSIHPWLAVMFDAYVGFSMIAFRDLCRHGLKIAEATTRGDLPGARKWSSWLVGRDIEKMDGHACNRAAVESMSENLVDGILSPLFYFILLGPFGLLLFKVASTMDSMVGYKNERYLHFGWFGARLDDVLNYIPARISYLVIVFVSLFIPSLSARKALRIAWDQHHLVPGPNAGWSEAACAGALQVRLVGPVWLKGKQVTDIWLGDVFDNDQVKLVDIRRSMVLNFWVMVVFVCLSFFLKSYFF